MNKFYSFEEMEVWQEARKLVRIVRSICKRDAVRKDFAFIDQVTKAARSVAANIAEGNDALTNGEFVTFLGYAKRSCAEVREHFYDALDENYISQEEFLEYTELTKKICAMLAKLIHHLQSLNGNLKRTFNNSSREVAQ